MSDHGGIFVTLLTCMDGRTESIATQKVKEMTSADFVDKVTYAGPDGCFSKNDEVGLEHIKKHLAISIEKHNSLKIFVFPHEGCAGFPVENEEHLNALKMTVSKIKEWFPQVDVIGGFLNKKTDFEWGLKLL